MMKNLKKTTLQICLFFVVSLIMTNCANTPEKYSVRSTAIAEAEHQSATETEAAKPPTETAIPPTETLQEPKAPIVLPTIQRYASTAIVPTMAAAKPAVNTGAKNGAELVGFFPGTNSSAYPKQTFYLSVKLKNTGTTFWNKSYKIITSGGTQLSYYKEFTIAADTNPGNDLMQTIYMTAPEKTGDYTQIFNFVDNYGALILQFSYNLKVGAGSNITAVASFTPTVTGTAQATPLTKNEWDCSDSGRSITRGDGCAEFCASFPFRLKCFVRGTERPTITFTPVQPTSTIPPTATPTSTSQATATPIPTETSVPTEALPTETPVPAEEATPMHIPENP